MYLQGDLTSRNNHKKFVETVVTKVCNELQRATTTYNDIQPVQ